MKPYSGNITELKPDEVFVFTSNDSGFHGAGSAGFASFGESGNVWRSKGYGEWPDGSLGRWNVKGCSEGPQGGTDGLSYAIPSVTKPGKRRSKSPEQLKGAIKRFYKYAVAHPDLKFFVAQGVEPGYNGYTPEEMASFWGYIPIPCNVYFLDKFIELIKGVERYYAGIGSRAIDSKSYSMATQMATELERQGWTLRSGNATGSDQAFAEGIEEAAQIWLPWASFEAGFQSKKPKHQYLIINGSDKDAVDSVAKYHPGASHLPPAVNKLMSRNFRQVIGRYKQPNSSFVLCWTPNGEKKGGTSQAIRIAEDYKIPVVNFGNPIVRDFLIDLFDVKEYNIQECQQ